MGDVGFLIAHAIILASPPLAAHSRFGGKEKLQETKYNSQTQIALKKI